MNQRMFTMYLIHKVKCLWSLNTFFPSEYFKYVFSSIRTIDVFSKFFFNVEQLFYILNYGWSCEGLVSENEYILWEYLSNDFKNR